MIDVKDIVCDRPNTFNQSRLEVLANAILTIGLVRPLIVKQTGLMKYELIAGDFEYYASVRAKELDPRKGEMVNAFVIKDHEAEAVKQQLELLK